MDAHRPVDIARGDPELAFHEFVAFNDGHFAVFRASGAGAGPWEMHPDTDELLFALEGSVTVEVFGASGNELVPLRAGSLVVIPRGRWHRHVDADELVELYTRQGRASRAKIRQQHPATKADNHRPPRPLPPTPVRAELMLVPADQRDGSGSVTSP